MLIVAGHETVVCLGRALFPVLRTELALAPVLSYQLCIPFIPTMHSKRYYCLRSLLSKIKPAIMKLSLMGKGEIIIDQSTNRVSGLRQESTGVLLSDRVRDRRFQVRWGLRQESNVNSRG